MISSCSFSVLAYIRKAGGRFSSANVAKLKSEQDEDTELKVTGREKIHLISI